MQEKHPIDERFRTILYEAEATPPEQVRSALAHRMGWYGTSHQGGTLPFLLLGVAGLALALVTWDPGSALAQEGHEDADGIALLVAEHEQADPSDTEAASGEVRTDGEVEVSAPDRGPSATATLATAAEPSISTGTSHPVAQESAAMYSPEQQTSSTLGEEGILSPSTPPVVALIRSDGPGLPLAYRGTTGALRLSDEPAQTQVKNGAAFDAEPFTASGEASDRYAIARMEPTLSLGEQEFEPGPIAGPSVDVYAPRNGDWWLALTLGGGRPSGGWTGADITTLNDAEQWRSGRFAGVGIGRSWRSGFGAGIGLQLDQLKSTLAHEEHTPGAAYSEVDTAWSSATYPGTGQTIYTWSIDTTQVVGPGSWQRTTAGNTYTALHVPITAWWHASLRRWSLGATAGLIARVPVQRSGSTLVRTDGESAWRMVDLSDPIANGRQAFQVQGVVGLSFGYLLTERLSLWAEPVYIAPLLSGAGATSLSLDRPSLQIRLQHVLRCH